MNSPSHTAGSSSMANSREGSRNVSREQSRNASRESSVSERTSNVSFSTQLSKSSSINESSQVINPDPSNTTFDEEKTQARVHSLIEEYTENYSDSTDRPVKVRDREEFVIDVCVCVCLGSFGRFSSVSNAQ